MWNLFNLLIYYQLHLSEKISSNLSLTASIPEVEQTHDEVQ